MATCLSGLYTVFGQVITHYNYTINGERFAELNFRVFRGFQEYYESLP